MYPAASSSEIIRRTGRSVMPSWEPIAVAVIRGWVATRINTAPWLDRKLQDGMISIILYYLIKSAIHDTINHATKSMLAEATFYHITYQIEDRELTGVDYYSHVREKAMRWQFWQNAPPQKLSDQVQRALTAQLRIEPNTMDDLRLLSKRGQYSSRKVEFIRIFDPALVEAGDAAHLSYQGLLEIYGHRKALLFEGRIEKDDFGGRIDKDNQVFLTDLRTN
jgi:hypothetical protein